MSYIALVEHSHPRIMMIDLPRSDVDKITKVGYEAQRAATGLHDRGEFCLPYATQDVEVVFAHVQKGSFTRKDWIASTNSVEPQPFFADFIREVWEKRGWIVLFIAPNTPPAELDAIGIQKVGVIPNKRRYVPESIREPLMMGISEERREQRERDRYNSPHVYQDEPKDDVDIADAEIPFFRGRGIYKSDDLETKVIERHLKSAKLSIFSCLGDNLHVFVHKAEPQPHIEVLYDRRSIDWLVMDESVDKNVIALRLNCPSSDTVYATADNRKKGGILLLPDFGTNNGSVALALLQEVFMERSPHLFDTPQHPWLENYEAAPVLRLQAEHANVINEARAKLEQIQQQIEAEREEYAWLLGLLISTGDQFASDGAKALRFLGFEVEEVDKRLGPSERKVEDYHIKDAVNSYFALGEAKTVGKTRGASEEFISKTQTHQARYAIKHKQAPPPALLLVNYTIDIEPIKRAGKFYQSDLAERLEDSIITALSSVALFDLCQHVLNDKLSKEQVRQFITSGKPIIETVTIEEVQQST